MRGNIARRARGTAAGARGSSARVASATAEPPPFPFERRHPRPSQVGQGAHDGHGHRAPRRGAASGGRWRAESKILAPSYVLEGEVRYAEYVVTYCRVV